MQPLREDVLDQCTRLGAILSTRGWTITAAESCTGGLLSAAFTSVSGSSAWFPGAWVTYSNASKSAQLGVPAAVLERHGAVSGETVEAMASGAASTMPADVAIAISGIAGPDGGVPGKPVGTVWIAVSSPGRSLYSECFHFAGDRQAVREQAVISALAATLTEIENTR